MAERSSDPAYLRLDSAAGRLALLAVTLGSSIGILDGSIVNVALRAIGTDLDASLGELQWVVNGYLLALASLVLVGGALGDRHGRRRTYLAGIVAFAVLSVGCALAQSPEQLIVARVLQGVAAAAVTPGGLALIEASFDREHRSAAIGWWAGYSGVAAAIGPFIGGYLVDHGGWRGIFLLNLPLCAAVVVLCRWVPESKAPDEAVTRFDVRGAVVCVVGLAGLTYALTAAHRTLPVILVGVAGVALLVWFGFLERHPGAMVPLELFGSRVFTAANLMSFAVYGALGSVLFLLVLQLQVSAGWSAIAAGASSVPLTIAMMLLSSRFSALAARTGPRMPMTLGPTLCAVGVLMLVPVGRGSGWLQVLPGMVVFALGLSLLVAPLTAAVLAAAPDRLAGAASGVNNAVSRAGSLLAVAALPAAVGLSGADYENPDVLTHGYRLGMLICAGLLLIGGAVSLVGLRDVQIESVEPVSPT